MEAWPSCLCANPQLPDGYRNGIFALLFAGIFVELEKYLCFLFSGRQVHVGTSPIAPDGVEPAEDAHRVNYIGYTPAKMLNGQAKYCLGSDHNGKAIFMTHEMLNANDRSTYKPCTRATWAREGGCLMEPESRAYFISRRMLDFGRYLIAQTADGDEVADAVDLYGDEVVEAVTVGGVRVKATELVPSSYGRAEELRSKARDDFADIAEKSRKFYAAKMKPTTRKPNSGKEKKKGERGAKKSGADLLARSDSNDDPATDEEVSDLDDTVAPLLNPTTAAAVDGARPLMDSRLLRLSPGFDIQESAQLETPQVKEEEDMLGGSEEQRSISESSDPELDVEGGRMAPRSEISTSKAGDKRRRVESDSEHDDNATRLCKKARTSEYPLLSDLTGAMLKDELMDLLEEKEVLEMEERVSNLKFLDEVTSLKEAIHSNPCGTDSPGIVANFIKGCGAVENGIRRESYHLRRYREAVMRGNQEIWAWLDETIVGTAKAYLDANSQGQATPDWLRVLVQLVEDMVVRRLEGQVFDPSIEPALAPLGNRKFSCANPQPGLYTRGEPRTSTRVVTVVVEILRELLGYPAEEYRHQAWVTSTLVEVFGEEVLLLGVTWKAYTTIKFSKYLSPSDRRRKPNRDSLNGFKQRASEHPMLHFGAEMHDVWERIKALSSGGALSTSSRVLRSPEYANIHVLLDAGLQYIRGGGNGACNGDEKVARIRSEMARKPNAILPFREKADDRRRLTGEDGPFAPQVSKTKEGLFSMVVCRAITWDTDFARRSKQVFDSYEDLERERTKHKALHPKDAEQESYFCKKNAYGGTAFGRKFENAKEYWDSAIDLEEEWRELTSREKRCAFTECVNFFRPPGDRAGRFKELGPLAAYLLACDVAYAGLCCYPSLGEVAQAVYDNDAGALKGLRYLGLVGSAGERRNRQTIPAIEAGLQEVMKFVIEGYSEKEREEMGFDIICVEHLLCKLSRNHRLLTAA
ncbi:hypothetical protein DFP72DRAFT_1082988 [Ephemerocybe angulata]|uniref:Uncharacterized protein n=2 Tax=Ephemerocybe angulata TaxID=980116 RepID=A0A8H6H7M3_9AGAR|nr:hypothetical protein DFP72DRAFT_1082988 [Tulosesus angulatus]